MDAPLQIRPARPADVAAIALVERRCFSDPWSADAFGTVLRTPGNHVILAEAEGALAGYFVGRVVAGEAEILNLAVAPEARRAGLGRTLLAHGLRALRDAGAREVFLEVRAGNAAAIALYQRHGFRQVGRRARYYSRPVEDALVLQVALPGLQHSGTQALDLE